MTILNRTGLSVVIPTYGREQVLVDTLEMLRSLLATEDEVVVVDQTPSHTLETDTYLKDPGHADWLNWVRLPQPSIPKAMNQGLNLARNEIVLFLDDDIVPDQNLLNAYRNSFTDMQVWAIAGQVLQPEEEPVSLSPLESKNALLADMDFRFNADKGCEVRNVMAGNLAVRRDMVLKIGGFDENFIGVAYRFETEFARRIWKTGGKILFEPRASIRHLRAPSGGTRHYGNHLTSVSPMHGVGDYYFAMRQGINQTTLLYMLIRPFREVRTRFHLQHPWWIPVKLVGELRAFCLAIKLFRAGPKFIATE